MNSSAPSESRLPPAILLIGPTASGKSALALELVDRMPQLEIVSVDSAQVFCGMDIGTAKPDAATRARYPHHLIDLVSPEAAYSAARFRRDALAAMADITARQRVPLLVGGTLLYFKALLEGLAELPSANADLRAAIELEAQTRGWPELHAELARFDPATAARINPNDAQRIQRALEILRLTGETPAAFFARQTPAAPAYAFQRFMLLPEERAWLHQRIAQRFEAMLKAGLVDELEALRRQYNLQAELPAMRSVGYRQAWDFLEGRITRAALQERGIIATRQLAKRQLTWMNGDFFRVGGVRLGCPNRGLPARMSLLIQSGPAQTQSRDGK